MNTIALQMRLFSVQTYAHTQVILMYKSDPAGF